MAGILSLLSSLWAHQVAILGGCNHWWLCHPCLLIWQEIFQFSRQCYVIAAGLLSCCLLTRSPLTLCDPMDCSPPGSSVHGFFRQEYWSGLPFPPPGDLFDSGIEPVFPTLAGRFLTTGATIGSPHQWMWWCKVHIHFPSRKKLFTKGLVLVHVFNKDISA